MLWSSGCSYSGRLELLASGYVGVRGGFSNLFILVVVYVLVVVVAAPGVGVVVGSLLRHLFTGVVPLL